MPFTIPISGPASPLARRPKITTQSQLSIELSSDSEDELLDDGSQSRFVTQPTQIVDRRTLNPAPPAAQSSPQSVASTIEVPASSPYRPPSKPIVGGSRLGSAMAPRGTSFRPPPGRANTSRQPTNQVLGKRPSPRLDLVDLTSDDSSVPVPVILDSSGDERPPRGDIRPTSFSRGGGETKVSATAASSSITSPGSTSPDEISSIKVSTTKTPLVPKGSSKEKRLARLIHVGPTALSKVVPDRSLEEYQKALIACSYDKDQAADWLRENGANKKLRREPVAKKARSGDIRDFIRSFAHKPSAAHSRPRPKHTHAESELDESEKEEGTDESEEAEETEVSEESEESAVEESPLPKPKPLGRLQRGLKARSSPQQSPIKPVKPVQHITIHDVSGDEDDFGQSSPALEEDEEDRSEARILKYLNECTVDGLLAICGSSKNKRVYAEAVVSRRPFSSLAAAERVTLMTARKGRGSKTEMASVGEEIIRDVSLYIRALDAIDVIVAKCEQEGVRMKSITDHWNMDSKGNRVTEQGRDGQMTPSSADGHPLKIVDLPIPREPELMRDHCSMKSYQLYGLNWLYQLYLHDFGCILADDMGLGKTCQVISFISHIVGSYDRKDGDNRPWPNLIVVPPSTFANWQGEFKKFAPGVKVTAYHGKPQERDELAEEILYSPEDHHVVLTTYSQLGREEDTVAMSRIRPNAAIFDEGHKVKNSKTNVFKGLSRIRANWRLLLTGTPIQNNIMEMINLLNFIQPELFDRRVETLKELFDQKVTLQDVSNGVLLFSDRVRRARSILEPFILQRQKEHVLSSMPPKTSRIVYCEMDAAQRKIYDEYQTQFRKGKDGRQIRSSGDQTKDKNNIWIQLRKSAIHSQLFRRFFTDKKVDQMAEILMREVPQKKLQQPNLKHLISELRIASDFELHLWCRDEPCISHFDVVDESWMQSGKVQKLLELLREFEKNGDRVLIFTRFATMIEILTESLSSAGISHLSLQGSTRVEERQDLIDEFNENEDITAFLLTTGAGGTGINLATANKVIIFDQSDNPQDDIQAENRAHRLGQTRPVEVIRLITKDSIEELIYKACQKKLELAKKVTGSAEIANSNISEEQAALDMEKEVRRMLAEQEDMGPRCSPESE